MQGRQPAHQQSARDEDERTGHTRYYPQQQLQQRIRGQRRQEGQQGGGEGARDQHAVRLIAAHQARVSSAPSR
jgi:hypothetical protein